MAFSVSGKRVVVVGGVRSGVAAAELLATPARASPWPTPRRRSKTPIASHAWA
jgi:cation diffusion facilitator CzcD-associated flavoprotein CzcO